MGFYAIIRVKMSLHLYPHSELCMRAANALVSSHISADSPDPLMLSIVIKLYHVRLEIKYYAKKKILKYRN